MPGTVDPVPERLHTVTPRLVFASDAARAIEFYGKAFGAEVVEEPFLMPDGQVVHAEIRIGDSVVFLTDEGDGEGGAPSSVGGQVTAVIALSISDVDRDELARRMQG
jgi:PhnB protein